MTVHFPSHHIPVWKRTLDLAICLMVMPVLAVFTLMIALVMQFTSPGPVFFRQERVGYRGRRFKCYKFRSMIVGADTGVHKAYFTQLMGSQAPMVKMDSRGDSRLIPGGWLLRASGLDELPQLINVLKGDMSIVGPRPCLPYEYENYLPCQKDRFKAAPGLTGLWQVSGKNRTTFDEMISLDIRYAETQSLALDLKIMLLTPAVLVEQIVHSRLRKRSRSQPTATVVNLSNRQPKSVSSNSF